MKILEPKWWFSKLPCLRWTVVNIKVRDKKYNFSHTKFYRGKICAMYNYSRSVEIHSFLSYLSGSGDVMFEREYISHGSLVLVSRQMLPNSRTRTCSISKFPPYNLKRVYHGFRLLRRCGMSTEASWRVGWTVTPISPRWQPKRTRESGQASSYSSAPLPPLQDPPGSGPPAFLHIWAVSSWRLPSILGGLIFGTI